MWRHSGVRGNVWMPKIRNIGKPTQKFFEGRALDPKKPDLPVPDDDVDWYWTPAVSSDASRKAKKYPAQRVIWVDCDESYDRKLLLSLRPSYLWETSPGHMQAVWLLKDRVPRAEYHRDGLMGMLTQALGADPSGVDIGQLLRVPNTWHHKGKAFQGRILASSGAVYTRGQVLSRVARGLGFSPGAASDLGADDPFGDRSKLIWKFSRSASELGLPQDLTFKLIKATAWNKWADEPERLKEDIAKAYDQQPKDPQKEQAERHEEEEEDGNVEPWGLARIGSFGKVLRKPVSWVLPGIIPEGSVGFLVAAPKAGKTRIATEIALGIATGRKPLGIHVPQPKPVGFLSYEDGEYLFADRLSRSLNRDHGRYRYHWDGHITPDRQWHPPEELNLFTSFEQADLTNPRDMQALYETIDAYKLKFVVIDTLSMAIGKANVSDQKEMNSILPNVRTIARATGCAIMFIHHTRKRQFEKGETVQESILGATALHAWAEFTLSLAAPLEKGDPLRLGVQTKMNEGAQYYISSALKIIKAPPPEEISE